VQSETLNELATALSKAQGEFSAIPKGELNPFFKSKYAGLPDVVGLAAPILSKNGLSVSQWVTVDEFGSDVLKTFLLHSSGQFIEFSMKMYLSKLDSQGVGSAVTYSRRYSYMSVLGLVADEDDDGNKASPVREPGEYRNNVRVTPTDASRGYEVGSGNDDFDLILKASTQSDNDFLSDISHKIETFGALSPAQLSGGVKAAKRELGMA
jgi:hypothetical protein